MELTGLPHRRYRTSLLSIESDRPQAASGSVITCRLSAHNYDGGAQLTNFEGRQNNNTAGGYQFNNRGDVRIYQPTWGGRQNGLWERQDRFLRRLSTISYLERKNRNPERTPGTCEWFHNHERFQQWKESRSSATLWVTADPGCGKSVLVRYLVDEVLENTESRTVCYFFFKDDFEDQQDVVGGLRSIIHQLFEHKRHLLSETILEKSEMRRKYWSTSFNELWQIFILAAKDRHAGEIVCLLDAIDESNVQGLIQLVDALHRLQSEEGNHHIKFLFTSRPYRSIRQRLQPLATNTFPMLRLEGEKGAEQRQICHEIDRFIEVKVGHLGAELRLTPKEQKDLLRGLKRVQNRTYIWVRLTLDMVQSLVSIDGDSINQAIFQLPTTVDEAYNRILSKSRDKYKAKQILRIVLAATRPLALGEMFSMLIVLQKRKELSLNHLKEETNLTRFQEELRDICGLFVTIVDHKIYLLHQTAREFLVEEEGALCKGGCNDLEWKHCLQPQDSQRLMAEMSIQYLLIIGNADFPRSNFDQQEIELRILLDYCAKNWAVHYRGMDSAARKSLQKQTKAICETESQYYRVWGPVFWESTNLWPRGGFTNLMLASYLGLDSIVKRMVKSTGVNINATDEIYRRSALSWAAGNGFDGVVRTLIKYTSRGYWNVKRIFSFRPKLEIDSTDNRNRTPLIYAVWSGNVATVKLLLKSGAKLNNKDESEGTPQSYAICNGNEEITGLLAGAEAVFNLQHQLCSAAMNGDLAAVRIIVKSMPPTSESTSGGGTALRSQAINAALFQAARHRQQDIVQFLLDEIDANTDTIANRGETALMMVSKAGYVAMARRKLDKNKFDTNMGDYHLRRMALIMAPDFWYEATFDVLVRSQ